MAEMDRRTFLALAGRLAATMGLGAAAVPRIVEALDEVSQRPPVIWLQGQSCSGCSVSLLNSDPLGADRLVTEYISLVFHGTISAATGKAGIDLVDESIRKGGYILAVEGAVPAAMEEACIFGGEPFARRLLAAARAAKAVLAVGTCAAFGGIPAAENNPTGSMGIAPFLAREGVATPVIRLPGCPVHPDWLIGTIVHVLKFGLPPLDGSGLPRAFFSKLVHDQCPRFADYEREKFAKNLGDDGCLFRVGCQGPLTPADCPLRLWNSGSSFCIRARAPCIGCASPGFSSKADYPFFPRLRPAPGQETKR